jgi:ubiquinone/menaquinone biosynthesis C-methylase UbiE/Fe2+ transport system protein FeoA
MNSFSTTHTHFIWKESLPCWLDFGRDLRHIGFNKVVELGSRVGQTAIVLSNLGLDVTTVDKTKENVNTIIGRAFQENCTINALLQTEERLPFDDTSIDAVITATALHHSIPGETKILANEIQRILVPGGRVGVAVVSTEDYRYGTGEEVALHTFKNTSGPEIGALHQFYNRDTLLSLFDTLVPESEPFTIPSMYVMDTPEGKKQGKLLCCRFVKGNLSPVSGFATNNIYNCLKSARRSIELVFTYPNTTGTGISNECLSFLNQLNKDNIGDIYVQCVIISNNATDNYTNIKKLKKEFNGISNFSLAYSEVTIESQNMDGIIIDGVYSFFSPHIEDKPQTSVYRDATPQSVNLIRSMLNAQWRKSTILVDNGLVQVDMSGNYNRKTKNIVSQDSRFTFTIEDFQVRRKPLVRVGIAQLNLNGILSHDERQLLSPDVLVLPNLIDLIISKSCHHNLDLLVLPELAGHESLLQNLQISATAYNTIIIGGSYYNFERINCCPIAIPGKSEPYIIEKINPSPYERSPLKELGITEGTKISVFKNTLAGDLGVVICNDYLNDQLINEIFTCNIDFLCVISLNGDSPRFFAKMNSKCKNDGKGVYILYSNSIFELDIVKADGKSSIFGYMDRIFQQKLQKNSEDTLECQISSFNAEDGEGLLIAQFNIDEKRPTYISPSSVPNIDNINKILF